MSYEEDYRQPYIANCACGRGFLRRYHIVESNDWGLERESDTGIDICCDYCKEMFHDERGFLVPNDLSFPEPALPMKPQHKYTQDERFIEDHSKNDIEEMIKDMTAPKHRYIKNLSNAKAIEFANTWALIHKKRSLPPMVKYLNSILLRYDDIKASYEQKRPFNEAHAKEVQEQNKKEEEVKKQSYEPLFMIM